MMELKNTRFRENAGCSNVEVDGILFTSAF